MREPNSISGARRARPAGWARALVTPLVAVGLVLGAGPASAGGSTWEADPASVAPGETVTVWAAVAWAHNDTLGTPEDGPYYAYLRELDGSDADWAYGTVPGDAIRVAEIDVVLAPYEVGPWKFGPNHAIFEFVMPDLEPGEYSILHCDDPCTTTLGDITWGSLVVAASDGAVSAAPGPRETQSPTRPATTLPATTRSALPAPVPPGPDEPPIDGPPVDNLSSDGPRAELAGGAAGAGLLMLAGLIGWRRHRRRT